MANNYMLIRKTVSIIFIINGLYVVITNARLALGTNYNFTVLN